jgi:ribonuclease P protein component
MNNSRFSLGADKRIKSSDLVSDTLSKGRRKVYGPLRLHYLPSKKVQSNRAKQTIAAFIVPKRIYRKATQRNQIRRWIKEAYRLNQEILSNDEFIPHRIIFIVQKKGISNYSEVEESVIQLLEYLSSK